MISYNHFPAMTLIKTLQKPLKTLHIFLQKSEYIYICLYEGTASLTGNA